MIVPALAALVSLVLNALTVCRTVYFGDSAELSAAAAALGVAHPPGYPLYLLLARIAVAALPGEPAVAVNLISALAAAATAAGAAALAQHLGARPVAALAAGLLVVGSRTVWSQSTVAEVYTLNAALAFAFLAALALDEKRPPRDLRALLLAVYLLGLGLAHHLSIIYVGIAGLVLLAGRRRLPWRAIPPAVVLAAVALSLYAVLVVRSRLDPLLDWGNPEGLARLKDHVTARPYHFLVGKLRGPDVARRMGEIAWLLASDLHPIFLAAIALGLRELRRQLAWLAALLVMIIALIVHAVVYGITDIAGHLVPAAVALAVVGALGLDVLARRMERALSTVARSVTSSTAIKLVVLLVAALPIGLHWQESDRSKHRSAREFGENLLSPLPQGATLFAEGDNQVFILAYLKTVGEDRSDVTVIDREGNLLDDFYRVRGEHGPPSSEDFGRHRLDVESTELRRWFAADPGRAVYFSGRTNLPALEHFVEETSGLVMRVRPMGTPPDTAPDPWARIRTAAIRHDVLRGDALTREVAARYWVRQGEAAFEHRDLAAMASAFDSALAVAPKNADLSSYLGAFHAQNGMLDRALPLLERAVRQNPLSVRGWTNLGLALIKSGRNDEGTAALRESLRIQPDQEQVAAALRRMRSPGR